MALGMADRRLRERYSPEMLRFVTTLPPFLPEEVCRLQCLHCQRVFTITAAMSFPDTCWEARTH